jgi:hypothetical protein
MSTTEPNLTTLTPFARLPLTTGPNGIIVNPVTEFDRLSRAVTVLSWSDIPTPWWVLRARDLLAGADLLLSVLFVAQCRRLVRGVRDRGVLVPSRGDLYAARGTTAGPTENAPQAP